MQYIELPQNGPYGETEVILLQQLLGSTRAQSGATGIAPGGSSFAIPAFDNQAFTYWTSTNNIQTIQYKSGSSVVATLTFTYVGGAASDNDKVQTITQS